MKFFYVFLCLLFLSSAVNSPVFAQEEQSALPDFLQGTNIIDFDLSTMREEEKLPTTQTPIDKPHIAKEEVLDWAVTVLTDAITSDAEKLADNIEDNKEKFTEEGFESLIAFLRTNRITNANLREGKSLSVINARRPVVVDMGVVEGAYGWLLDIRLIVSVYDAMVSGHKDFNNRNEQDRSKLLLEMAKNNSEHILKVQVVRVAEPNGTQHQIAIDKIEEEKPR